MNYPRAELVFDRYVEWLQADEDARRKQQGLPDVATLDTRLKCLVTDELPSRWRMFQLFKAGQANKQADQFALQFGAAAREAVILNSMLEGENYAVARSNTLCQLYDARPAVLASLALHESHLESSFGQATGSMERDSQHLRSGFVRAAGLAVAHLTQRAEQTPGLALPAPGHASGEIVPWDKTL